MQPFLTQFSIGNICLPAKTCIIVLRLLYMYKKELWVTKSPPFPQKSFYRLDGFATLLHCLPSLANSWGTYITCHCTSLWPRAAPCFTAYRKLDLIVCGTLSPGPKQHKRQGCCWGWKLLRGGRSRGGLCSIPSFLLLSKHLPAPAKLVCLFNYLLIQIRSLLTGKLPPLRVVLRDAERKMKLIETHFVPG